MAQENWWDNDPVANPTAQPAPRPGPVMGAAPRPKDPPAPKTSYRTLSKAEAEQRGLDPTKVWQESSEGNLTPAGNAAGASKTYKTMPQSAAENLEKGVNAVLDFDRITKGYKKDFAGNSITGGLENSIQKRFGGFGTPGQQQWWADVNANDNVMRNALFGASLTAGEQAAWDRTTITPDMDPALVEQNLKRRKEIATSVLKRRTDFFKANGYDPEAVDALLGEGAPLLNGVGQSKPDGQEDPLAVGAVNVPSNPGTYRPDGTPVDPNQLESGPGPNEVWIVRQPDGSVVNWETISGYGGGEVTPKEWMSDEARLNGMDLVDGNDPAYMQFAAGVGDIVEGGINNTVGLVANPINTVLFRALGYDNYTSDIGQTARDGLGLPETRNQTISAINQAVTGGLVTGGLASLAGKSAALPGMAQNALAQYGATPIRDAVTAGTAAAAGEGARASGAGPAGQFAATLAGGFTPAAGAGLVQRAASRGAKPNALAAEVMGPFERSNVPMRQADFDPAARPQRAALEKSEKGRPIIQAADEADQAAMEARLTEIGGTGRASKTPYDTGAMVQGALTRQGDRTKTAATARYKRAEKLSGDPAIEPTQAISTTAQHVAGLQAGAANTNAAEIKFLTGLGEDLSTPGGKTISQLRDLRTNLRGRLKEQGLDHGQAEARALSIMDAASADIEAGLKGNPRALEQYKLGDKIWRERADFRKNVTAQLIGKNGEKSAIDTASQVNILAKKDPVKMKRLMDEFEPEERADFVATIAANLGRNNKGEFTPNLLLNNLDPKNGNISPQSLRLVFGDDGVKAIKDLQFIAKSKIAARSDTAPSGAAIQNAKRGLRTAIFAGIGYGAGDISGAVVAPLLDNFFANLSDARKARLLTNPVFTKHLRNAPETTNPKAINTYFDRMTQSAAKSPVFAMDVEAFKQALAGAANKSTTAAAAGEQEQN